MGQTPAWGLPYPEQSTLITDSAAIVQELAEKIDGALSAVTASDEYTVPGTLLQEFTTTGIFRPSAGITLVHVVVIGGGGKGVKGDDPKRSGGGGGGGGVRIYRSVPVAGPVEIIIGGPATASSFGAVLTAPAGNDAAGPAGGMSQNWAGAGHGGRIRGPSGYVGAGSDGVKVNGVTYAGGGGYGNGPTMYQYGQAPSTVPSSGGAGGGGGGSGQGRSNGLPGVAGSGGGGGGCEYYFGGGAALGGSGRVMIYTEQNLFDTLALPTPTPDPLIVAALDDDGVMTGAYAVDVTTRELPAHLARVVAYPLDPVETGRTEISLVDPEDPTGPTAVVPILAWPEAGWKYTNNTWEEPKNE